jgi:thiamine biosynthesis lipoprotein
MKKLFVLFIALLMVISLSACNKSTAYNFTYFDYMDTMISISVYVENEERANELNDAVESIYEKYHELTNNYGGLSLDSPYLTNIYEINQTFDEDIEIDPELYELLVRTEEIKTMTNGYFDVSIGKIIDAWKEVILNEEDGYIFNEIPQEVYENVIAQIQGIAIVEEPFILSENAGKYYIRLLDEDVKIDLGAFAKGYATQLAYDYLMSDDVTYFSISAGSSSISVGENQNRDTGLFHISLANPVKTGSTDRTYGMIYVQNIGINTSGNYEQYALYQGLRYHHIISPKTKMPMQYYHTVTILGHDAGLLDAFSTALFSMPSTEFETFMNQYQEIYQLEVIRFNYDETVSTFLQSTVFEDTRP